MAIRKSFNLNAWIEENRHLLKPPVGNKNIYPEGTDFIVMIVAGPNARKDYHYNETEELFYQLEGNITVRTQQDGEMVPIHLGPEDMFLLPPKTPHSPNREDGSIGLVIERVRSGKNMHDGLMWFCEQCNHPLHEVKFELNDVEKDFLPHFKHFYNNKELRTCKQCSSLMEADARFID